MISSHHICLAARRVCLVLVAAACVAQPLFAQPAAAPAAKPKVKLAPRPLPGTGSPTAQTAPDEAAAAGTETRVTVPVFRPAAVTGSAPTQAETLPAGATQRTSQAQSGPERARITLVRRRGTFQLPKEPAREAPVIVNDLSDRQAPAEAVPVALPPGKVRVIPRDSINVRTSLPPSQP